jgi:hypothetical protein
MDFSTIERKLASSNPTKPDPIPQNPRYRNADEFVADVRLIFSNCVTFNGPDHAVTAMGKRVEEVFDKQIKQMPAAVEVSPYCYSGVLHLTNFTAQTGVYQETNITSPSRSGSDGEEAPATCIDLCPGYSAVRERNCRQTEARDSSASSEGPAVRGCSQKASKA